MPTAPEGRKAFSITLPDQMHSDFINLFPETGGRTAFLREVIAAAIMLGKTRKLSSQVVRLLQLEERRREE